MIGSLAAIAFSFVTWSVVGSAQILTYAGYSKAFLHHKRTLFSKSASLSAWTHIAFPPLFMIN